MRSLAVSLWFLLSMSTSDVKARRPVGSMLVLQED